jgi:hypothetical protein
MVERMVRVARPARVSEARVRHQHEDEELAVRRRA